MAPLTNRLLMSVVESEFDGASGEFVPEGSINAITKKDIEEEFRDFENDAAFSDVVEFIHSKAKRLFAIALCGGIVEHPAFYDTMTLFMNEGFSDEKLPIKPWGSTPHELTLICGWSPLPKIRNFYKEQWQFLVPVFQVTTENQEDSNHDFERNRILPLTKCSEGFDSGSFGKVYKYKIHPQHLIDPENSVRSLFQETQALKPGSR